MSTTLNGLKKELKAVQDICEILEPFEREAQLLILKHVGEWLDYYERKQGLATHNGGEAK